MIDVLKIFSAVVIGYLMFLGSLIFLLRSFFPFADKKRAEDMLRK